MDNPQISVLIPMYNRKHYIADCVNSVLNQTFQDTEVIVRDNCSTDGGFEFLAEKYAEQIATGRVKIFRNPENLGETGNIDALIKDATGKYFTVLHSDDIFLPHALQHLYEVAEKTNADVVHQSFLFISPPSGIINDIKNLRPHCYERNTFKEITVLPNDPMYRFREWLSGIHYDIQYNFFNREFALENGITVKLGHSMYCALRWLMLAKVIVKTPIICYIRRDAPDALSRRKIPPVTIERFMEGFISTHIDIIQKIDRQLSEMDFFKNNELFKYIVEAHFWVIDDSFEIFRRQFYKDGITPEIYQSVANAFKKYFSDDLIFFPILFFHWLHVLPYNQRADMINYNVSTPPLPGRRCRLSFAA